MSNHTPGPWVPHKTDDLHGHDHFVMTPSGFLGYLPKEIEGCGTQLFTEDDARLIAAAPELLEACQTFAEWLRREDAGSDGQAWAGKRGTPEGEAAWREWWDENLRICNLAQEQVRAAITKATGK